MGKTARWYNIHYTSQGFKYVEVDVHEDNLSHKLSEIITGSFLIRKVTKIAMYAMGVAWEVDLKASGNFAYAKVIREDTKEIGKEIEELLKVPKNCRECRRNFGTGHKLDCSRRRD